MVKQNKYFYITRISEICKVSPAYLCLETHCALRKTVCDKIIFPKKYQISQYQTASKATTRCDHNCAQLRPSKEYPCQVKFLIFPSSHDRDLTRTKLQVHFQHQYFYVSGHRVKAKSCAL